jgi:hypothetical protein
MRGATSGHSEYVSQTLMQQHNHNAESRGIHNAGIDVIPGRVHYKTTGMTG